jgi:hypothetical protein
MGMPHRLAGLFLCAALVGCGNGGSPPPSGSINPPAPPPAAGFSIRFFGTGTNDVDRVKIPLVSSTGTSLPVNVGSGDFTIEFWIKGTLAENDTPACTSGAIGKDAWMGGAIVIDRDVLGDGDFGEFGISLFRGRIAFGVAKGLGGETVCGSRDVLDGVWHHVALERDAQLGELKIFVDGAQDTAVRNVFAGGDVSYNPAHTNPAPNDAFLVLGAAKPGRANSVSFRGQIDELRLSTDRRYKAGSFLKPTVPFVPDAATAALYHFDEGSGTAIADAAGASPGTLMPSAAGAAAHWSTDTPF